MTDMVVALRLTGDGSGLAGAVQLSKQQLDDLSKSASNANAAHGTLNKGITESTSLLKSFAEGGRSAFELMRQGFEGLRSSVESFKGAMAGIGLALEVRDIIDTSLAMDHLNGLFNQATGSARGAREQLELVRQTADALGTPFMDSAQAYGQLLAEIKDTAVPTQVATNAFLGASEAVAAMRLSGGQAQTVFNALLQLFARGPDGVEQFRQSIGIAIPGLLQKLAQSLHLTEQQFQLFAQQGRIAASDVQSALGPVLDQMFRQGAASSTDSLTATFNRLKNAWEDLQLAFADAGFIDAVADGVRAITKEVGDPEFVAGVQAFSSLVGDLFRFVVDNAKTLTEVFAAAWGLGKAAAVGSAVAAATGAGTAAVGAAGGAAAIAGGGMLATLFGLLSSAKQIYKDSSGQIFFLDPELGPLAAPGADQSSAPAVVSSSKPFTIDGPPGRPLPGPPTARPAIPAIDPTATYHIDPKTAQADLIIQRLQQQATLLQSQVGGNPSFDQQIQQSAALKAQQAILQGATHNPEQIKQIQDASLAVEKLTADLKIQGDVLQSVGATQGDYQERLKVINDLYNQGTLSVEQYQTAVLQADERMLASHRDWESGVQLGFLKAQDAATNMAAQSEQAVTNAFSNMTDAITNFATTGKLNVDNLTTGILNDLIKIQVQSRITGPLSSILNSQLDKLLGSASNSNSPSTVNTDAGGAPSAGDFVATGHAGAVIGEWSTGATRVPLSIFAGARRHHTGTPYLGADEVPFVGKRGEVVGWPDQMARAFGGGTNVQIIDQRGAGAAPVQTQQTVGPDGREQLRLLIQDQVNQGFSQGAFDKTMRNTYRTARAPAVMRG